MRRALVAALLCSACLPRAWDTDPAAQLVSTARPVKVGFTTVGGGFGGGGGGGGFGGGGGGMPSVGNAERSDPVRVIGSYAAATPLFSVEPSRSGTLARVRGGEQLVAVVDDADALFLLAVPNRRFELPAGSRPSSVCVAPDGRSAWVALRGLGSVAKVDLETGASVVVPVGAEPTGVALTPSGAQLVVATFGEHTLTFVDTRSLVTQRVEVGPNPRAVLVTNDGDGVDDDETVWVTLYFGEPLSEASNTGRRGVVVELSVMTRTVLGRAFLSPLAPTPTRAACSPNLLSSLQLSREKLFVTHHCVSPAASMGRLGIVQPAVSVIDVTTRTERLGADGSRRLPTSNLGAVLANPVDAALLPNEGLIVLGQAATAIQNLDVALQVRVGVGPRYNSGSGGEDPREAGVLTGLLATGATQVTVLDASARRLVTTEVFGMVRPTVMQFETLPLAGSKAQEEVLGRRHFATAEGGWATQTAIACSTCHPDGLTDNVTWSFGPGPRQTPSLAGSFVRGDRMAHRLQGWTATADEIADVEHLVRTLGGTGVIVRDGTVLPLNLGYLGPEGVARHDGLSASSTTFAATANQDWAEVEAWIVSLPRPPASPWIDRGAVARGRQLFVQGGCAACHGGELWSISMLPYVPSYGWNGSAVGDDGRPAQAWGPRLLPRSARVLWDPSLNTDSFQMGPERVTRDGGMITIGPERVTCVLRNVGTFDAADPLEVKSNNQPAQGERGFSPPSLLGVATSAPYLHHGRAKTLNELFSSARFARHTQAAVIGFLSAADGGANEAQVADLVAFLESIDETTPPLPVPPMADLCE